MYDIVIMQTIVTKASNRCCQTEQRDARERKDFFMVVAGDFKNGVTFEMDGNVLQVIEFQHVKPGKGAAFVRTKLKKCYHRSGH